jgi:glycosyltransferase involved in cell wall biosynthesis
MTGPAVSVVLPVRDGEPYVAAALSSIIEQSFADLEVIVVDDGSTDGTPGILRAVRDARVRVITQGTLGVPRALNRAIAEARGAVIARMDADDVALPERLQRQLEFLQSHPDVGLLGTGAREVDRAGRVVRTIVPPAGDAEIRRALVWANPFVHASVVFHRQAFEAAGGYDPSFPVAQDYELWTRMASVTRMANLAEPLLLRRLTPTMVSRTRERERRLAELRIRIRQLRRAPGRGTLALARVLAALALPAGLERRIRRDDAR